MGDFFRGWKRKTGCITLILALLFMCGWIRSLVVIDQLTVNTGKESITGLMSFDQSFVYVSEYLENDVMQWTLPEWESNPRRGISSPLSISEEEWSYHWSCCGFSIYLIFPSDQSERAGGTIVAVPYWSIVFPFTAVSMYLLFSKPRKSTLKRIEGIS